MGAYDHQLLTEHLPNIDAAQSDANAIHGPEVGSHGAQVPSSFGGVALGALSGAIAGGASGSMHPEPHGNGSYAQQHGWYGKNPEPVTHENTGAPPINWPCLYDGEQPRSNDIGEPVEQCKFKAGEPTNATFLESIKNTARDGWETGNEGIGDTGAFGGPILGAVLGGLGGASQTVLNAGAAVGGGVASAWHAMTD